VLYKPPAPNPQQSLLRHRCRNPRCLGELVAPTFNRLEAFCCRGCFAAFFRSRCLVCEQILTRKNERQRTCRRPKCRSEFKRYRAQFSGGRYPSGPVADISPRSAHSTGLKSGTKPGRAWRPIAGPAVPEINLQILLDPETAGRLKRDRAKLIDHLKRSSWATLIRPHYPPTNILGGYRFPGAPKIDLSPVETTAATNAPAVALAATIPSDLSVPGFLKRARGDVK
jgi:hypothetical protein